MNIAETDVIITGGYIYTQKVYKVTSARIEQDLLKYKFEGANRIKDEEVEKSNIPYIAPVFYRFVAACNRIPSPDELMKYYFNQTYFKDAGDCFQVDFGETHARLSKEGLMGRVWRAYPSLIRDIHFHSLCTESGIFQCIKYDLEDDLHGTDLTVTYRNQHFKIALMVNTPRSNSFKNQKETVRHNDFAEISLPLSLEEGRNVNDFRLYSPAHINRLVSILDKTMESNQTSNAMTETEK